LRLSCLLFYSPCYALFHLFNLPVSFPAFSLSIKKGRLAPFASHSAPPGACSNAPLPCPLIPCPFTNFVSSAIPPNHYSFPSPLLSPTSNHIFSLHPAPHHITHATRKRIPLMPALLPSAQFLGLFLSPLIVPPPYKHVPYTPRPTPSHLCPASKCPSSSPCLLHVSLLYTPSRWHLLSAYATWASQTPFLTTLDPFKLPLLIRSFVSPITLVVNGPSFPHSFTHLPPSSSSLLPLPFLLFARPRFSPQHPRTSQCMPHPLLALPSTSPLIVLYHHFTFRPSPPSQHDRNEPVSVSALPP